MSDFGARIRSGGASFAAKVSHGASSVKNAGVKTLGAIRTRLAANFKPSSPQSEVPRPKPRADDVGRPIIRRPNMSKAQHEVLSEAYGEKMDNKVYKLLQDRAERQQLSKDADVMIAKKRRTQLKDFTTGNHRTAPLEQAPEKHNAKAKAPITFDEVPRARMSDTLQKQIDSCFLTKNDS